MITLPRTIRVWAYGRPDGSAQGVQRAGRHREAASCAGIRLGGDLFLFVNRRRTGCKVLMWDGTGLCIFMKRLERGRFADLWGDGEGRTVRLTHERAGAVHRGLHARREEIAVAGADHAE